MVKTGFDPTARGDQPRLHWKTKILPRRHESTYEITYYIKHLFAYNHTHLERVKVEDAALNTKC